MVSAATQRGVPRAMREASRRHSAAQASTKSLLDRASRTMPLERAQNVVLDAAVCGKIGHLKVSPRMALRTVLPVTYSQMIGSKLVSPWSSNRRQVVMSGSRSSEQRYEVLQSPGVPIKSWTRGVPVEEMAKTQLQNIASMPFIHKWVAAMPDVHVGIGATVGSVVPTLGAVIPAAVGVDIGCGMMAVRTSLQADQLPESLGEIRAAIEAAVPVGRDDPRKIRETGRQDSGAWDKNNLPEDVVEAWEGLADKFAKITRKHQVLKGTNNVNHLGTLGTGNHFIEVCLDEQDRVWFLLHSGSRGVGNKIGTYFIEKARQEAKRRNIWLPDKDLAYLEDGTESFNDYVEAVEWAQNFARTNREVMMARVITAVRKAMRKYGVKFETHEEVVNCHHNYVNREHHYGKDVLLTRKGAVSAREGQMGIIPGSMGAKSFIVRGLGNPESFHSCSHGAGRVMSRTHAKKVISLEEHHRAIAGVECRMDADVIDESPAAYKPIEKVMRAQKDLIEVVHTLKQVVCVKG
eukprot:gnl/TRDRNA2_/TRDRNA2_157745_c2_seq1.p1 gnl/TRDRNA2_/TRDRNA2_157745_c2~~gnl/TRDRNA2_/TRDRNA2_157745_c2_seq1.p1  ORF type:complete len:561 (+),score=66.15 gnl/TRDRNA2_/TRDRNA2_157745_c2_seq1:128-1684(+)